MTRPGIEPRSPRRLANTLTARPMSGLSSPLVWWCQLPRYPSICTFPFIRAFKFCLDLVVPFCLSGVVCYISLLAWPIFSMQIPFLCPDCIFSLRVLEFPVLFNFLRTIWCRPCTLGDWFLHAIYLVRIRQFFFWVCG